MQQSIDSNGAGMEKFFAGMMQNGGLQDLTNVTRSMQQQGRFADQNAMNQIKASGIPIRSSAAEGAAMNALQQNALQRNMQIGQMELGNQNQAMARQFQGAQGLAGMPAYYAQPSSLEAQMLGLRMPYDMAGIENARLNAQLQNAQMGYGAQMGAALMNQNWQQPDTVVLPPGTNWWADTFAPALIQGGLAAVGAAI